MSKKNIDQVAVIYYDKYGTVDAIYLETIENAKKMCILHNLGYFLSNFSSEEDEKLAATLDKLITEEKWEQVFQIWDDEDMDEYEFSSPARWYEFDGQHVGIENFSFLDT